MEHSYESSSSDDMSINNEIEDLIHGLSGDSGESEDEMESDDVGCDSTYDFVTSNRQDFGEKYKKTRHLDSFDESVSEETGNDSYDSDDSHWTIPEVNSRNSPRTDGADGHGSDGNGDAETAKSDANPESVNGDANPECADGDADVNADKNGRADCVNNLNLTIDDDNLYCRPEEPVDPLLKPLLVQPIVWREDNFQKIHVRGFLGNGQVNLPPNFDTSTAKAIDYWKLFVTDENIRTICENTNKYYKYKLQMKRITRPNYVDKDWVDLTPPECSAYLGMCLLMGISPRPRYKYFWSSNPFLRNAGIANVMPLSRYAKISEYFHVSDREKEIPNGQTGYDKLAKIRWFIDSIHMKFKEVKSPDKNQAINESIVKYSGRIDFKQWNCAKQIRGGLKIVMRCDSYSGFAHIAHVYFGKKNTEKTKMGLYFDLVNLLTKDIRGKNHHVFFDNLYTSVPLIKFLYTKQIYACGTIRSDKRIIPSFMRSKKQSKLSRGVSKTYQDTRLSNLIAVIWKDVDDVKMVGTTSTPGVGTNIVRRVGGRQIVVQTPNIVKLHGKNYSGVNKIGGLVSQFKLGRLSHYSKKWWKHVFYYYYNLTVANALIIHKLVSTRRDKKYVDNLKFRLELGTQLINGFTSRKQAINNALCPYPIETVQGHRLTRLPVKRARICRGHKRFFPHARPRETVYGCADCQMHFCFDCFPLAHSVTNS